MQYKSATSKSELEKTCYVKSAIKQKDLREGYNVKVLLFRTLKIVQYGSAISESF